MAANIWAELIKQGFENMRGGFNNLSQGTASIAQGANNGIQNFNPQTANNGYLGIAQNTPNFSGIAEMINQRGIFERPSNPNIENNAIGREILKQTSPTMAQSSNTGGNTSSLGRALTKEAPSLFDRLKF